MKQQDYDRILRDAERARVEFLRGQAQRIVDALRGLFGHKGATNAA